jgi:putative DNA primase/helicase
MNNKNQNTDWNQSSRIRTKIKSTLNNMTTAYQTIFRTQDNSPISSDLSNSSATQPGFGTLNTDLSGLNTANPIEMESSSMPSRTIVGGQESRPSQSWTQDELNELKDKVRIPIVWEALELPGDPKKSTFSPFRNEDKPSFSVFDDGKKFKDFGDAEAHGDVFDFVAMGLKCSKGEAIQWVKKFAQNPKNFSASGASENSENSHLHRNSAKKDCLPLHLDLKSPSKEQIEQIAKLRRLPNTSGLTLLATRGLLHVGNLFSKECWVITDKARKNARFRPMTGTFENGVKSRAPSGAQSAWPINDINDATEIVVIVEGEGDLLAASVVMCFIINGLRKPDSALDAVAFACMTGSTIGIPSDSLNLFRGKTCLILGQNDEAGQSAVHCWARQLTDAGAAVVKWWLPEVDGCDLNDAITTQEDLSTVADHIVDRLTCPEEHENTPPSNESIAVVAESNGWPDPESLSPKLSDVIPATLDLLPPVMRSYIDEESLRSGYALDFYIIPTMVALGAGLGNKVTILPTQSDRWKVHPNLYGMTIGEPGTGKSPGIESTLKPVLEMNQILQSEKVPIKERLNHRPRRRQENPATEISLTPEEQRILNRDFLIQDSTPEALEIVAQHNPEGVLIYREELTGLFSQMKKSGRETERELYLTAYEGNRQRRVQRIGRNDVYIPKLCLSIIGTIQPSVLEKCFDFSEAGDGLIQRFSLMVHPDPQYRTPVYGETDERKYAAYRSVMQQFYDYRPVSGETTTLRYCQDAYTALHEWKNENDVRVRDETLPVIFRAHLSKMIKPICAIAAIFQLCENIDSTEISLPNLKSALRWYPYLISHALRVYGGRSTPKLNAAYQLKAKIEKRELGTAFTFRDLRRKRWHGLTDEGVIRGALSILKDVFWIRDVSAGKSEKYEVNPKVLPRG